MDEAIRKISNEIEREVQAVKKNLSSEYHIGRLEGFMEALSYIKQEEKNLPKG